MSLLKKCLYVFGMSMLPVVELRGSIPLGAGLDLPWHLNYMISVLGNFLPVPFILLFIRQILHWMQKTKWFSGIANWLMDKAHRCSGKVLKYASWGLFLFVAIPLPGTGAWTGALVASVLDMRMKYALPSILGGVLVAGFVMSGISYGFLGFLQFLA